MPIIPGPRVGEVAFSFRRKLAAPGAPEDLVAIPTGYEGVSIVFYVDSTTARVAFDEDAAPTVGVPVKPGDEPYNVGEIRIRERVSFMGDPGGRPEVYGMVWLRRL